MAGRGRGMTMPAWMTQGRGGILPGGAPVINQPPQPGGLQPPFTTTLAPPFIGGPPGQAPSHGQYGPPPPGAYPGPAGPAGDYGIPGGQYPPPSGPLPPAGAYPPPLGMDGSRRWREDEDERRKRPRGRSNDRIGGGGSDTRKPYASSRIGGSDRATLRARRLYVGGTNGLTERDLLGFFNTVLAEAANIENGALAVTVNERNFSFVEFSEVEIMHAVLELRAMPFRGKLLNFEKPKDYELLRELGPLPFIDLARIRSPDFNLSMMPPPRSTRIRLDGLSPNIDEATVGDAIARYGEVLGPIQIIRDPTSSVPAVFAIAEFADPMASEEAIRARVLNLKTGEVVAVSRAMSDQRSRGDSHPRRGGVDHRPARRPSPSSINSFGGPPRDFPPPMGYRGPPAPPGAPQGLPAPYYSHPPRQPGSNNSLPPPGGPFGGYGLPSPYAQPSRDQSTYNPSPAVGAGGAPPALAPPFLPAPQQPPGGGQPLAPLGGAGLPPPFTSAPRGYPPAQVPQVSAPPQFNGQYGSGVHPPNGNNYGPPTHQATNYPPPGQNYNGYQSSGPGYGLPLSQQSNSAPPTGPPGPTRVLLLLNMVTREELASNEDYAEIFEDTESEARKFGTVERVVIPRAGPGSDRVFILFKTASEAMQASRQLNGRRFSNRTVEARYYDENLFMSSVLDR